VDARAAAAASPLIGALALVVLSACASAPAHDFSHDFLVGQWTCRDAGPSPVQQLVSYSPAQGGTQLIERALFRAPNEQVHGHESVIVLDPTSGSFVWGVMPGQHASGGYVSQHWFQNGRLRMRARHDESWFTLTKEGHDAFTFAAGGDYSGGTRIDVVTHCARIVNT
jgi:hypothetical protein